MKPEKKTHKQQIASIHAAYVRLVEKMPCIYADASGVCGSHWQRSCKLSRGQLLAAFARYKKGTR